MIDEERQKLCKRLRSEWSTVGEQVKAAAEIERLAARVKSLETVAELNLQEGERLAAENGRLTKELQISNKALSMCSDECNRLYEKYDKKLEEIQHLKKRNKDPRDMGVAE